MFDEQVPHGSWFLGKSSVEPQRAHNITAQMSNQYRYSTSTETFHICRTSNNPLNKVPYLSTVKGIKSKQERAQNDVDHDVKMTIDD
jgi:hypothetical protein